MPKTANYKTFEQYALKIIIPHIEMLLRTTKRMHRRCLGQIFPEQPDN